MVGRMAVVSDTGRRRRRNEDAFVCAPPLFAVADGMGGAQAGEVASGLAAAVLEEGAGDERGEERVASLIQEANRRVFQRSNEDAATSGMGTTMTVALVDSSGGTIAFGHVGDSRAYRVRDGRPRAAHGRPFARRRAGPQRQALAGGGGDAPAALGDHAGARHRAGRRRGHVHGRGPAGRPLPALLGRVDGHDLRGRDLRGARRQRRSRGGGTRADRGGERGRWRGQHHRRPLPDRTTAARSSRPRRCPWPSNRSRTTRTRSRASIRSPSSTRR